MFIVQEQIMNGTVTMDIITTLIDKPTFSEAVAYFNEKCGKNLIVTSDTPNEFTFQVLQKSDEPFMVYGSIRPTPVKVL